MPSRDIAIKHTFQMGHIRRRPTRLRAVRPVAAVEEGVLVVDPSIHQVEEAGEGDKGQHRARSVFLSLHAAHHVA